MIPRGNGERATVGVRCTWKKEKKPFFSRLNIFQLSIGQSKMKTFFFSVAENR